MQQSKAEVLEEKLFLTRSVLATLIAKLKRAGSISLAEAQILHQILDPDGSLIEEEKVRLAKIVEDYKTNKIIKPTVALE